MYQLLKQDFGLDVLAGQYEFTIFKRTVSYITLPMSALEHRQLFMREMSNGWRSYVTYDINPMRQPLNEGPFHAALKALRLENDNTEGATPFLDTSYISVSSP
jgi:hypothetical protein